MAVTCKLLFENLTKQNSLRDFICSSIPDSELSLLDQLGRGESYVVPYECGHDAFINLAENYPDFIAVEDGFESITYGELNRLSDDVARSLIADGTKVGDYIGIVTKRSIPMIINIFGVLKSGAAYVPIDSTIPTERIRYMLEMAKCKFILVHEELKELQILLGGYKVKPNSSKSPVMSRVAKNDPAIVVFTSGSTGKPKGIVISHCSLSSYAYADPNELFSKPNWRVAQMSSISFDMCITEIFTTLSTLGTLVLRKSDDFFSVLKTVDATVLTPSALIKMEPMDFPNLKVIVIGGEACPQSVCDKWAGVVRLYNCYGPSETSMSSSMGQLLPNCNIHIGKPIKNTLHYIVDKFLQLVPFGVTGELVIGGAGVSLGYINQPQLTEEKFLINYFENDGSKMYRTGDVCRWTEDGNLQIMGRLDDMVKVKGYRIELNEVSAMISTYKEVEYATVILKDEMLLAFVTPKQVNSKDLHQHLSKILPIFMLPSKYIMLDTLPMNQNGKVSQRHIISLD
ncbi:non-ribosomal peptide synthetase modules-like protein [Globomyces pollinis-pini]|nr:non-ribosomal peptide synthetase modules-like protein [Globomyces pollinis-pini]